MTASAVGRIWWGASMDNDGHREYKLKTLVKTTDFLDGPGRVMVASGIPATGATWTYGNDNDPWAFCYPAIVVNPILSREKGKWWEVENTFGTKPLRRCQTTAIENPLAEPQKISGSFVKYTKETQVDANGDYILTSSFELVEKIERDFNRASIVIEQNVANLELNIYSPMIDTLNDNTLWGLPARRIKLSNATFERKLYGTCTYYYTRRFEFDVWFEGFDLSDVVDAGWKVFDDELHADTPANRADPRKYKINTDARGQPYTKRTLLDGAGNENISPTTPVYLPTIELYPESNFLTLGIPTSL